MSHPGPSPELPARLAPFAATLHPAEFARLSCSTWDWIIGASAGSVEAEKRLPALVTVASVYAALCAPSNATERECDVVARFTLLFFLVDDAELDELPDLLAETAPWSIGRHTAALRVWLDEFREMALAAPRLRERFARAYHDYLRARQAEHGKKRSALGVEEHWAFRRRSIFMDPYLDLWMILRQVDLDDSEAQRFSEARALAVDLVLLANDLASVERDAEGGASPDDLNLVHTYAREHGESEAAAFERLVATYGETVARYLASTARALGAHPTLQAERYVDLLTGVVEGNVASVRALAFRYPGADRVLVRLASARPT